MHIIFKLRWSNKKNKQRYTGILYILLHSSKFQLNYILYHIDGHTDYVYEVASLGLISKIPHNTFSEQRLGQAKPEKSKMIF